MKHLPMILTSSMTTSSSHGNIIMNTLIEFPISLNDSSPRIISAPITLPAQTSRITVRLKLPTTSSPLAWDENGVLQVTIVISLDGKEYARYQGGENCYGGIRTQRMTGVEYPEYRLSVTPPCGYFNRTAGALKMRLGETAKSSYTAHVEIECIRGEVETTLAMDVLEYAGGGTPFHNSIAHETESSVSEVPASGDTLTCTHTGTGADLVAVIGCWGSNSPAPSAHAVTYDGSSTGVIAKGSLPTSINFGHVAAFVKAGIASGVSKNYVLTTTGVDGGEQGMIVATLTGVDQTTPAGTEQTSNTTQPSVTVGSVNATDLVIGILGHDMQSPTIGANQTEQESEQMLPYNIFLVLESQLGSNGGAMDWTLGSSNNGVGFAYIAFALKEATTVDGLQSFGSQFRIRPSNIGSTIRLGGPVL